MLSDTILDWMDSTGYIRTDMGFDYEEVGNSISVDALPVFLAIITEIVPDGQPLESLQPLVVNLIDLDPNCPPQMDNESDNDDEFPEQHDARGDEKKKKTNSYHWPHPSL